MPEWTIRLIRSPPPLSPRDRAEVAVEVARLRVVLVGVCVRVRRNPSGLLGIYTGLLLDGVARVVPLPRLLPAPVRRRYGRRRWFTASRDALAAFVDGLRDDAVGRHGEPA